MIGIDKLYMFSLHKENMMFYVDSGLKFPSLGKHEKFVWYILRVLLTRKWE